MKSSKQRSDKENRSILDDKSSPCSGKSKTFSFLYYDSDYSQSQVNSKEENKTKSFLLFNKIVLPRTRYDFKGEHWICANFCDFTDSLYILYNFCKSSYKKKYFKVGSGFPLNIEYRFNNKRLIGYEYIECLFKHFLETINNKSLFITGTKDKSTENKEDKKNEPIKAILVPIPTLPFQPKGKDTFCLDFKTKLSKLFTQQLRIFSILLCCNETHFNKKTNFSQYKLLHYDLKRFIYFAKYWKLIDFTGNDTIPLEKYIKPTKSLFRKEYKKFKLTECEENVKYSEKALHAFETRYQHNQNYKINKL